MSLRRSGLLLLSVIAATVAISGSAPREATAEALRRPNILLIVADDLGYSDLGAFGSEIRTPNLDRLAARGVVLSSFYTSPACSPTRAMLLTGSDNHKVGLGSMAELITPEQRGVPGYEGYINKRAATLAERLEMFGYHTMMSGKWHLGKEPGQIPSDRGFARSFALLQGDHNHFGLDQSDAFRKAGAARDYILNGRPTKFPEGSYGDDVFASRLLEFLEQDRGDRPFFAYLAFTGPHWPLQAPPEDITRYRQRYDAGPAAIQNARLDRMRALGLVERKTAPYPADEALWTSMSAQDRAFEARKMEIHAAMIDRLDQNVGRVFDYLKAVGKLENTIIIFMSDNGADGHSLDRPFDLPNPGKVPGTAIDNRLESIGTAQSYISLGRLWAQVSSTPLRGVKLEMTEGGIRTPAIVAGPGVWRNGIAGAVTHVTDVVPTVLDFVNASADPVIRGRPVLTPDGSTWVGLLAGRTNRIRQNDEMVGWETLYRRAVRAGRWKAVYQPSLIPLFGQPVPLTETHWQLFDLAADPGETRDLAAVKPGRLGSMTERWNAYAASNSVVLPGGEIAGTRKASQ